MAMKTQEKVAAWERAEGFAPVYNGESKVLIMGSFPSVKSRQTDFYYGNKQNRFWKMISSYFNAPMPENNEQKKMFILRHGIALWDSVISCDIVGSKDDSILNYVPADVGEVLKNSKVKLILLNGKRAMQVFEERNRDCGVPYRLMPSTSPANPRYDEKIWREALNEVFGID